MICSKLEVFSATLHTGLVLGVEIPPDEQLLQLNFEERLMGRYAGQNSLRRISVDNVCDYSLSLISEKDPRGSLVHDDVKMHIRFYIGLALACPQLRKVAGHLRRLLYISERVMVDSKDLLKVLSQLTFKMKLLYPHIMLEASEGPFTQQFSLFSNSRVLFLLLAKERYSEDDMDSLLKLIENNMRHLKRLTCRYTESVGNASFSISGSYIRWVKILCLLRLWRAGGFEWKLDSELAETVESIHFSCGTLSIKVCTLLVKPLIYQIHLVNAFILFQTRCMLKAHRASNARI